MRPILTAAILLLTALHHTLAADSASCPAGDGKPSIQTDRLTTALAVENWNAREKPSPIFTPAEMKKLKEQFWTLTRSPGEAIDRCSSEENISFARKALVGRTPHGDPRPRVENCHGMSYEEYLALMWYTGDGFKCLNEAVTAKGGLEKYGAALQLLNSALARLPEYKGEVLHTLDLETNEREAYVVGATVRHRYYTSASTVFKSPYRIRSDIFTIKSKHGRSLGNITLFPEEGEVLFAPYTRFKVLSRKRGLAEYRFTLEEVEEAK